MVSRKQRWIVGGVCAWLVSAAVISQATKSDPPPAPVASAAKAPDTPEQVEFKRCVYMGWQADMGIYEANEYCRTFGIEHMATIWYRKVVLRLP